MSTTQRLVLSGAGLPAGEVVGSSGVLVGASEPSEPPSIVDSFDRANTASTLGVTDTGDVWATLDSGDAWGISGGEAYMPVTSSTPVRWPNAVVEWGSPDVDASVTLSGVPNNDGNGLCFRYVDANNFWALVASKVNGRVYLEYRLGGSWTVVSQPGRTIAAGDTLRVVAVGDSIWAFHNGELITSTTSTVLNTATKVGLHNAISTSAAFNARWDDFSVREPSMVLSGGTVTRPGDGYEYRTFTSSGDLTVLGVDGVLDDWLLIAGGGQGGHNLAGGGGAGGYLTSEDLGPLELTVGTYPVGIGAGGFRVQTTNQRGANGGNSTFAGLTAIGGGGGGGSVGSSGEGAAVGGSGGGGGLRTPGNVGAAGTTGQGFKGGDGFYSSTGGSAGGGGGAGGTPATPPSNAVGGNGGPGRFWLDGVQRAAGGGGCTGGQGGAGGGGNGGDPGQATVGAANTGSGGGGGASGNNQGAAGGSGILIVRVPL